MRLRKRAEPHQRDSNRDAGFEGKFAQFRRGIGEDNAAASVKHRAFRLLNQLRGLGNLARVSVNLRFVTADVHRCRIVIRCLLHLGILGDVNDDGPRLPGARDVKRLGDDIRHLVATFDEVAVLADRARHTDNVTLLEGIAADVMRKNLSGNRHHRDRVHVGGCDAGDKVRRARARCRKGDSNFSSGAGVSISGVRTALFVPHWDEFYICFTVERVENRHRRATVDTEDILNAFPFETFNQAHGS